MSKYHLNIRQVIYSLSDALDLVGVNHIHHGKRVAYIAAEIGKRLGWEPNRLDDLYNAAILHDCGVSKTIVHAHLAQMEWEFENEHCALGASLLQNCPALRDLSEIVRHHHTHWSQLKQLDLPQAVKLNANCIYLADRTDILTLAALMECPNILLGKDKIRDAIKQLSGDWFAPELVDAFLEISKSEAFWFSLESEHVNDYALTWVLRDSKRTIEFEALRSLVHIFSIIVDAKSPFTKEHSDGVARLARFLGAKLHLPAKSCEMLELAGLLHDLGKLRVPDELLDKPGKLTAEEYAQLQRHSFDSFNILKTVHGLEEIAAWASEHHERIDGSGYPFHLKSPNLSLESRILAVADVFHALAQNRPYRPAMPPEQVMHILRQEADAEKLDKTVVDCVENNLLDCWKAALLINA